MSNFEFLKQEWPEIHKSAHRAEELARPDPGGSLAAIELEIQKGMKELRGMLR